MKREGGVVNAERLVDVAVHAENYTERINTRVEIVRQLNERERLRGVVQELLNRFYPHRCDSGPDCAKCRALLRGNAALNGEKGEGGK